VGRFIREAFQGIIDQLSYGKKEKPAELHVLSHILSKLLAMITLGEALPYGGARGTAPTYFTGGGSKGMEVVETSKLISTLRNDAQKTEKGKVLPLQA
jgi:hypothetical protein